MRPALFDLGPAEAAHAVADVLAAIGLIRPPGRSG